ncbi:alpha-hydroxy-acid oxidizing protein [Shewanella sp. Scap07]|uniref:alpha-hydroxy-acid oxidizing protein n=1 Tax=Shewanella sp. Scap07 TaxID=2589987 RepID=UPI0015C055D5|nr:alpha-hydroxy-acid oxidizing protein [Shewanella sp. Scap07]QLE84026.1 alpha-hydroxy-acid oxidizing protein [Shewanella sp. Scap07]
MTDKKLDTQRREFLSKSALLAATAGFTAMSTSASASPMAVAASSTSAKAVKGYIPNPENLKDVLTNAKKIMDTCAACDIAGPGRCNGKGPCGETVPGMGGKRQSFINNVEAFEKVHFNLSTVHNVTSPVTEIELFGVKLSMPILTGITGGLTYNMGAKGKLAFDGTEMTEAKFVRGIVEGAYQAGTLGWAADGIGDPIETYRERLTVVKEFKGRAVAQIKPRTQKEIFERIDAVQQAGAPFFAIDIDSAGRAARALPGRTVEPKDVKKLKEIVKYAKIPFIAKGIMTVEEAMMCVEAGCAGIVVSDHGGRVLSSTPASLDVLPAIVKAVRDANSDMAILFDSGVRDGGDVLKALALGAQAVLVGRPFLRASLGGGAAGVEMMFKKMHTDLVSSMVLTGVANVNNVPKDIIYKEA